MMKTAFALLLASLLTGCGASAVPAVYAPGARAVRAQAAAEKPALVLSKATRTTLERGSDSSPVRFRFDLEGTLDGKPATIVVTTFNPTIDFYVPTLDKVLVNGKQVKGKPALRALAEAIAEASEKEKLKRFWWAHEAAMIVLVTSWDAR